jgi:hypothetical protein
VAGAILDLCADHSASRNGEAVVLDGAERD